MNKWVAEFKKDSPNVFWLLCFMLGQTIAAIGVFIFIGSNAGLVLMIPALGVGLIALLVQAYEQDQAYKHRSRAKDHLRSTKLILDSRSSFRRDRRGLNPETTNKGVPK